MAESDVQRDIGRMEGDIAALVRTVGKMSERLDETDKKVGDIKTTLAEARGGWRVLMLIGGAAGVIGGLIATYLPFLKWGAPS